MSAPDRSIDHETVMAVFARLNRQIVEQQQHAQTTALNAAEDGDTADRRLTWRLR